MGLRFLSALSPFTFTFVFLHQLYLPSLYSPIICLSFGYSSSFCKSLSQSKESKLNTNASHSLPLCRLGPNGEGYVGRILMAAEDENYICHMEASGIWTIGKRRAVWNSNTREVECENGSVVSKIEERMGPISSCYRIFIFSIFPLFSTILFEKKNLIKRTCLCSPF